LCPRFESERSHQYAGVAQLIERFLAKEEARGLSPLTRTKIIMTGQEEVRLESQIWANAFALGGMIVEGENLSNADRLRLYEVQQLFLEQFDKGRRQPSPGRLDDDEMLVLASLRAKNPTRTDSILAEL
jgi:hypothetical protein